MTEAFHEVFDPRKPAVPTALSAEDAARRADFKIEELVEFLFATTSTKAEFDEQVASLHEAVDKAQAKVLSKKVPDSPKTDPLVAQVDTLVDLLYLTYGSFSLMGVDPQPLLAIVHEANMGKRFPDGLPHYDPVTHKVLKPDNWEAEYAPEGKIAAELERQTQQKKRNAQ